MIRDNRPWVVIRIKERLIHGLFLFSAFLVVLVLAGIFYLLARTALPVFNEISVMEFFFSRRWNPSAYSTPTYGILTMLYSTVMVTVGALAFAVPLGIGAAAFLTDIASPEVREIVKPTVEILAGIPSVVLGFIGIVVLGPIVARVFGLPNGLNAFTGSILLGVMALPTIISISEDALISVPKSFQQASLAMGATRWQTLIRVKIPAALSGLFAASVLGMGRAIGETMTVLMVTGNAPAMPSGFLDSVCTMTATIAIELGEVPYFTTHYYALFAVGLVLFVITFLINMIADIVLRRYQHRGT